MGASKRSFAPQCHDQESLCREEDEELNGVMRCGRSLFTADDQTQTQVKPSPPRGCGIKGQDFYLPLPPNATLSIESAM